MGFLMGEAPTPEPVVVIPEKTAAEKAIDLETDLVKQRREQKAAGSRSTFRTDTVTGIQIPS